jgi:hypothetical protein
MMQLMRQVDFGATAEPAPENNALRYVFAQLRDLYRVASLSPEIRLLRVEALAQQGKIDGAIDEGFRLLNDLLHRGAFRDVDDVLDAVDSNKLHADVVVALLTATFPARNKLARRDDLIDRLKGSLLATDPEDEINRLIDNLRG